MTLLPEKIFASALNVQGWSSLFKEMSIMAWKTKKAMQWLLKRHCICRNSVFVANVKSISVYLAMLNLTTLVKRVNNLSFIKRHSNVVSVILRSKTTPTKIFRWLIRTCAKKKIARSYLKMPASKCFRAGIHAVDSEMRCNVCHVWNLNVLKSRTKAKDLQELNHSLKA